MTDQTTPLRDRIAEAALAAVEAALGDTLLPSARAEALAGITTVLPAPVDRAAGWLDAAQLLDQRASSLDALSSSDFGEEARAVRELTAVADELRRKADETAATETKPVTLSPTELTMLDYALNQAQLRIWDTGKYTAEEQAALVSLRRLTADQPAGGARQDGAQP